MTNAPDTSWIALEPPLPSKASQDAFVEHARALAKAPQDRFASAAELAAAVRAC